MSPNSRPSGKLRASKPATLLLAALLIPLFPASLPAEPEPELEALIRTVLDQATREEVPFRDVIAAATGHRIVPLDPSSEPGRTIVATLSSALETALTELGREGSPVYTESRVNEISRHFEEFLEQHLNALDGFTCARPRTAEGNLQSSGYPDLRLVHEATGTVIYLDPKLVSADSLTSSFRTFYFTPRTTTNKVLEDAHHLLAGILHDGNTGAWAFTGWKLIDLHDFRIRLKAEYQASNRDLYRPDLLLGESAP